MRIPLVWSGGIAIHYWLVKLVHVHLLFFRKIYQNLPCNASSVTFETAVLLRLRIWSLFQSVSLKSGHKPSSLTCEETNISIKNIALFGYTHAVAMPYATYTCMYTMLYTLVLSSFRVSRFLCAKEREVQKLDFYSLLNCIQATLWKV